MWVKQASWEVQLAGGGPVLQRLLQPFPCQIGFCVHLGLAPVVDFKSAGRGRRYRDSGLDTGESL